MTKFPIGAYVVYQGKSYRFPGEVTMRDETGVVVKAFGDSEGNYTGMKHIYSDTVLAPYEFGANETGIPPLVIFADENPFPKMRQWLQHHGHKPGEPKLALVALRKLFDELEELAAKQADWERSTARDAAWEEREAEAAKMVRDIYLNRE